LQSRMRRVMLFVATDDWTIYDGDTI
jgi:hypothetical protein